MHGQQNVKIFMYVYFYSLHVSSKYVPIINQSMRYLVYVTLCGRPSGMQVCIPDGRPNSALLHSHSILLQRLRHIPQEISDIYRDVHTISPSRDLPKGVVNTYLSALVTV